MTEDASSTAKRETFKKVKNKILKRAEKLCRTQLNGKNIIREINENAILVIKGPKLELTDFKGLNFDIRQILIKYKVHLQPACREINTYLDLKQEEGL